MGKEFNCVCDAVENIHDLQEAVEDQCPTSCYSNLLSPANFLGDTIPFILYTKKGEPFKAFGNIGGEDCFKTPFFRVENIDDCCATLSLLMPDCSDICGVNNLVKTAFCIEVDLSCFCAIQCLDPRLVVNSFSSRAEVAEVEVEDEVEEDQVEDHTHGHKRRGHRH
ncbi:spore coat protein [Bacillus sp. BGMRC 2118]|nr:spore coat protein [Bacillus sp. BGMRC 2118]